MYLDLIALWKKKLIRLYLPTYHHLIITCFIYEIWKLVYQSLFSLSLSLSLSHWNLSPSSPFGDKIRENGIWSVGCKTSLFVCFSTLWIMNHASWNVEKAKRVFGLFVCGCGFRTRVWISKNPKSHLQFKILKNEKTDEYWENQSISVFQVEPWKKKKVVLRGIWGGGFERPGARCRHHMCLGDGWGNDDGETGKGLIRVTIGKWYIVQELSRNLVLELVLNEQKKDVTRKSPVGRYETVPKGGTLNVSNVTNRSTWGDYGQYECNVDDWRV